LAGISHSNAVALPPEVSASRTNLTLREPTRIVSEEVGGMAGGC
jgi:hypothetical protein